ncbi:hypothetical protein HWV62_10957 [Athelia sp. TMB]|nr:hypothetical protein HWV62_10957 [Athelia sp. TMB]
MPNGILRTGTLSAEIRPVIFRQLTKKQLHILSMPLEILGEIARNLDWLDVIHVRMTCKILQDVTKLRSVRLSLVHQALSCDPYSTLPGRPIESYSSDELESWAIQRLSADKDWCASDDPAPSRTKMVIYEYQIQAMALLPGGRWLLTALKGGHVVAADLDHPDAPQHNLISPQEESERRTILGMLHCNYPRERPSSFTLALLHGLREDVAEEFPCRQMRVWQVTLTKDGTHLSASPINSFWTNGTYESLALHKEVISGDLYARAASYWSPDETLVDVFDWRRSSCDLHHKAMLRLPSPRPADLCIEVLWDKSILVLNDECLWIYGIPDMKPDTQCSQRLPEILPPVQVPIHVLSLSGGGFRFSGLSPIKTDGRLAQLALCTGSGVYGLNIFDGDDCSPFATTLIRFGSRLKDKGSACVGLSKTLIYRGNHSASAISYSRTPVNTG